MPFDLIDNPSPASLKNSLPPDGVSISPRSIMTRAGGRACYIRIEIGLDLARELFFIHPDQRVALGLGYGPHKGCLGISVDANGQFVARKAKKRPTYVVTIGAAAAAGLFALDFPAFAVTNVKCWTEIGKPPVAIIKLTDAMLDAPD